MTVSDSRFFLESGKTRMRRKWCGKRQVKDQQLKNDVQFSDRLPKLSKTVSYGTNSRLRVELLIG